MTEGNVERRRPRWAVPLAPVALLVPVALLAAIALSGCASGREARGVSRTLLARTLAYEERVDGRIAAERVLLRVRLESLRDSLAKDQPVAEEAVVERSVCSFQARTAQTDRVLPGTDVRDFVDELIRSIEASRQRGDAVRAEYDAYLASLGDLEARKQSIVKVRRGLEYLAAEPSEGQRLSEWFDFVTAVADRSKLAPPPK